MPSYHVDIISIGVGSILHDKCCKHLPRTYDEKGIIPGYSAVGVIDRQRARRGAISRPTQRSHLSQILDSGRPLIRYPSIR